MPGSMKSYERLFAENALPILEEYLARAGDYGTNGWLFSPAFHSLRDDPAFQEIMADQALEGRRPQRLGTDE